MKKNIKNNLGVDLEKKAFIPKPFVEPKNSKPLKPKVGKD